MKRIIAMLMTVAVLTGLMAGCGDSTSTSTTASEPVAETTESPVPSTEPAAEPSEEPSVQESSATEEMTSSEESEAAYEPVDINVGTIKGPTGAGMVKLMDDAANGTTANNYTFTLSADASEVVTKVIAGEYDIACMPTQ